MALIIFVRGANQGQSVELIGDRIVLGRNQDCGVVIPVAAVSREHAVIRKIQGKYYLEIMLPGSVLGVIQLFREASGAEGRMAKNSEGVQMDDTHKTALDKKTELRRTLIFFAWFIGGAIGIWLLGIVITLPLLVFLYMIIEGREKLVSALVMTVCTYGLIWGLFEYTLEMRWPSGLLFGY